MFSETDTLLLNRSRWERFFSEFEILLTQKKFLSENGTLEIYCTPEVEAELLEIKDEISRQYWLLWGHKLINIWCQNRRTAIHYQIADLESSLLADLKPAPMTTATLERSAINGTQQAQSSSEVPLRKLEDVIEGLVKQTGMSAQSVQAQLEEMQLQTFSFDGMKLVSPDAAIAVVDRWAERIKSGLFQFSVAESESSEPTTNGATPAAERKQRKKTTMRLPAGFKQMVTRRYQTTLEKILPDGDERQTYLQAIVDETDDAKEFVSKIASAIKARFGTPDPKKAAQELMNAAKAMLTKMEQPAEQMEQPAEPEAATV